MLEYNSMPAEFFKHLDAVKSAIAPTEKLRYINWYIQHGCDLDCFYCKVPKQKVGIMTPDERVEALTKIRPLFDKKPMISIIGGEPTLRPEFLIENVQAAHNAGFLVNLVSNGWGLTPDLINRLAEAGLQYLAISVDCDAGAEKSNLAKALELHKTTREQGIIPVINTVITRNTKPDDFKNFTHQVITAGSFISPLVCSPEVPEGVFSSAARDAVPTQAQLREIVPWLAWQKIKTGRVTVTFSYLWTLFNMGTTQESTKLWHCSPHFRTKDTPGRGYLTLDSDGWIGPCQEFPRQVNLLEVPAEQLSLQLLDQEFSEVSQNCPGCLYNCYIVEESLHGPASLAETSTFIQFSQINTNKPPTS